MNKGTFSKVIVIFGFPLLAFFLGWNLGQSTFIERDVTIPPVNANQQEKVADTSTGAKLPIAIQPSSSEYFQSDSDEVTKEFRVFWEVWKTLRNFHPNGKSTNDQAMVYGAIKGIAESLKDPYTYFLTPDESKEFNTNLNGELEGIGAELTEDEGNVLTVVTVLPGTPAEKSGVLPGDIVLKINGETVSNIGLYAAVQKIRGPKGTTVTLTLLRKGEKEAFDKVIPREEIKVPSVKYDEKEGGKVGYIRINKFSESTSVELGTIVNKILLTPPKALIIDLRDNGGGYLDASVEVMSYFLDKGTVVTVKHTRTPVPQVYTVKGDARLSKMPIVVLVNEQSASASEIVAGAFKDYKRAIIIGTHTFGKGSVQELDRLSDGSSLRFTTAKWYTPNGQNVGDKVDGVEGIIPDENVPLTNADRQSKKDPQLERALGYLKEKVIFGK